jgi:CAAX prenyl protease-like protein
MLWAVRKQIAELQWRLSWEAVSLGLLGFFLWIGLDSLLVRLGLPNSSPKMTLPGAAWNPHVHFGEGSLLAWTFITVRILGSTLLVPPLEEIFYRSFLYRYLVRTDFQSLPLGTFLWMPFIVTSVIFGLEHREWLAGILCGFLYQGLVCWKKRIGDAVTAHAITNFLLGVWVVWKGEWNYW